MRERFKNRKASNLRVIFLISVALHLLGLMVVFPLIHFSEEEPLEVKPLKVRVVDEKELNKVLKKIKKKTEKKKVKKRVKLESTKKRKAVAQETNSKRPKLAKFVSKADNKVEVETRARKPRKNVIPATKSKSEKSAPIPKKKPNEKRASKKGEVLKKAKPIKGLVRDRPKEPKILGNPFQKPTLFEAKHVLEKPGFSASKSDALDGRKLMKNYEKNDKALKASLENYIPEVRPGNHTGVNAHKNLAASYLGLIHRKIHPLWADNFLIKLDLYEPIESELNKSDLATKLEFVVDGRTGEVEKITIVKSSGVLRFDAEAIAIGHQVGPHQSAPEAVISPNGKVYIHWNFWRNQRQCGTFGASIFLVDSDKG